MSFASSTEKKRRHVTDQSAEGAGLAVPSRSGSETRRRETDVRFRMDEEEIAALDAAAKAAGFAGPKARGDWLRHHLKLTTRTETTRAASHQRVSIPGGQELLAELGKAGVNLTKLPALIRAINDDYLPSDRQSHVRENLERWIEEAIVDIRSAVTRLHAALEKLGPGR
ncbi:MAG TPA: hypothetical protein VGC35_02865 [Allosphingosinicella sp.]|jgi:hypothetical protein